MSSPGSPAAKTLVPQTTTSNASNEPRLPEEAVSRTEPRAASPQLGAVRIGPPPPPRTLPSLASSRSESLRSGMEASSGTGASQPTLALSKTASPRTTGDGPAGDGGAGPPVYLNDTERMLLVSCMDVDPYAPSQILSPAALPPWLQQQHPGSGGSVDGSGTTSSGAGSGRSVATEGGGSGSLSSTTSTAAPSNALGLVVSMGRLASSKSAVFVSLFGIHMLVGHWIPRVWPGQTMSDSWRAPPCTVVTPLPTFCCNRFCHFLYLSDCRLWAWCCLWGLSSWCFTASCTRVNCPSGAGQWLQRALGQASCCSPRLAFAVPTASSCSR
jgi:hypothetical protein